PCTPIFSKPRASLPATKFPARWSEMARASWRDRIATARAERVAASRVRVLRTATHRDGARVEVLDSNGTPRKLLNFCSNDYLGLSQHFAVINALQDAASREGAGGIASHLVCGHHAMHVALEK